MNVILLGGACLGAMAVILGAGPDARIAGKADLQRGEGSMTREYTVNQKTGETEETDVIAFND